METPDRPGTVYVGLEDPSGSRGPPAAAQLLTVDTQTVPLQGVGAQLGDAVGQPAQLPVQLLPVQPGACGP